MVGFCEDESVIGSEFYVMERWSGTSRAPSCRRGRLSPEEVRELCTNTLDLLVDLHAVDPVATGLDSLGKGEGYVGRQVAGWSGRFRKAKTGTSARSRR